MKIGNLDISSFKVGGADCSIYLGSVKLYPSEEPTPPSFDGKYKFTLTDDSVVSGECDASSAITNAETSAYTNTLKEAVIGDCVTSIGYEAFLNYIRLTSVTIGSGVTTIGEAAFYSSSLESITIPSGVTSIGVEAFFETPLRSVTVKALTPPTLGDDAFDGTSSYLVIYVPSASVDAYKASSGWSDYASRIQAIPT